MNAASGGAQNSSFVLLAVAMFAIGLDASVARNCDSQFNQDWDESSHVQIFDLQLCPANTLYAPCYERLT
jgi:hypothetical protein